MLKTSAGVLFSMVQLNLWYVADLRELNMYIAYLPEMLNAIRGLDVSRKTLIIGDLSYLGRCAYTRTSAYFFSVVTSRS